MLFICYPRCTTCQKPRKWLDDRGIAYEFRDIKVQNPTVAELAEWHEKSGLPLHRFWNTSGMQYRELKIKERLPGMTAADQIALLATDGMLVRRPVLVGDGFVLVGFKAAEWEAALPKLKG
jgi:arsenate reductase